jgi:hypothetical protein
MGVGGAAARDEVLQLGAPPVTRCRPHASCGISGAHDLGFVTRLLGPLERIGLVTREASPRDVRLAATTLTPAGRERVREALITAGHVAERLFAEREDAGELLGLGGELQRLSAAGDA